MMTVVVQDMEVIQMVVVLMVGNQSQPSKRLVKSCLNTFLTMITLRVPLTPSGNILLAYLTSTDYYSTFADFI
jgi:hypothetical protein